MQDLHPSQGAGDGRPEIVTARRQPTETQERIIRCPHCGLPNDDLIESVSDPEGESNKLIAVSVAVPSGNTVVTEKQRTSGCRFCGLDFRTSSYRRPFFSNVNQQRG
jgi:hypothetical protein